MKTQHTKTYGLQLRPPVYRILVCMFISTLSFTWFTFLSIGSTLIEGHLWARHCAEVWRFRWPEHNHSPLGRWAHKLVLCLHTRIPVGKVRRRVLLFWSFTIWFCLLFYSCPAFFSSWGCLFCLFPTSWYLYSPFQMISFVDFIQLMLEPWLLDSGYLIFPISPPPPAQGTRLTCNISLREVELDSR